MDILTNETETTKSSWLFKSVLILAASSPLIFSAIGIFRQFSIPDQTDGPTRQIASINEEKSTNLNTMRMDLSELSVAELKNTFKYQLLRDVRATQFKDSLNLSLGLFMIRDTNGGKVFVCNRYPDLQVILNSGKKQKTLSGSCEVSDDQNHIEVTSVGLDEVKASSWNVTTIKLIGREKDDILEVTPRDLQSVLGKDLQVEQIQ